MHFFLLLGAIALNSVQYLPYSSRSLAKSISKFLFLKEYNKVLEFVTYSRIEENSYLHGGEGLVSEEDGCLCRPIFSAQAAPGPDDCHHFVCAPVALSAHPLVAHIACVVL